MTTDKSMTLRALPKIPPDGDCQREMISFTHGAGGPEHHAQQQRP